MRKELKPIQVVTRHAHLIHIGHRQILRRVAALAHEHGWKAAALTFDPHPTTLVAPARAPRLLTTTEQRARMMLDQGIDEVLILPFTPEIATTGMRPF